MVVAFKFLYKMLYSEILKTWYHRPQILQIHTEAMLSHISFKMLQTMSLNNVKDNIQAKEMQSNISCGT